MIFHSYCILFQPHASLSPLAAFIITSSWHILCFPTFLLLICEISSKVSILVEEVIVTKGLYTTRIYIYPQKIIMLVVYLYSHIECFLLGDNNPCFSAVQTEKFMASAQETVTISLKTIDTDSLYYLVYNINRNKKKDSNKFRLVVLALLITYVICYSKLI